MLTEKTFKTGSVSINYVEGPSSGVPLVMLHGITTRWQVFLPALPSFLARYHTFALDLRGHGKSSWVEDGYTISDDVADVTSFLREQVKEPAVMLGWSLGAIVALVVAAEMPDMVRALVLADPPLAELTDDDTTLAGVRNFIRALHDIAAMDASTTEKQAAFAALNPALSQLLLRKRFKHLSQCDPNSLVATMERTKFEDKRLATLLPQITCPVLLIRGNPALGGVLDQATADVATSLLADCVDVYLPDAGHGVHDYQPIAFFQMVSDFLESL